MWARHRHLDERMVRHRARQDQTGESRGRVVTAYRAKADEETTNEAKADDMARIAISVVGLDGEEQEVRLVQREMASCWAGVQAVYRRAVGQALAEQQQEQARQQSLLILFGCLQQINQNL
jgi:hypothetical protein